MFFLERPPYSFVLPSAVGEKPPSKGHHLCIHENLGWKNGISRALPKHCNTLHKGPFKKNEGKFLCPLWHGFDNPQGISMNPSKYRKMICCTLIASPRLYDSKGPGTCWSSNDPHRWPGCPGTACQIWTSEQRAASISSTCHSTRPLWQIIFDAKVFFLQPAGDSIRDLFGMVIQRDLFGMVKWPPIRDKNATNWITWQPSVPFAFLPKSHAIGLLLMQIQWHGGMARSPLIFWPNCVTLLKNCAWKASLSFCKRSGAMSNFRGVHHLHPSRNAILQRHPYAGKSHAVCLGNLC